ncbi:MAG: RidA family protein [bacterium]
MRNIVKTDKAPPAIGPYSQAVIAVGPLIFTAGQIPMHPETGVLVGTEIKAQTRQVLSNLQNVLEAAGSSQQNVVKCTVFLQSMEDFAGMNEVYAQFFSDSPPARSAVEVAKLPKGALVEIEAVALAG